MKVVKLKARKELDIMITHMSISASPLTSPAVDFAFLLNALSVYHSGFACARANHSRYWSPVPRNLLTARRSNIVCKAKGVVVTIDMIEVPDPNNKGRILEQME